MIINTEPSGAKVTTNAVMCSFLSIFIFLNYYKFIIIILCFFVVICDLEHDVETIHGLS